MAGTVVSELELDDIQGLVARGYGGLGEARFLLLRVTDSHAATHWLGELAAQIPSARASPVDFACHLACTWPGLLALGHDASTLNGFSLEFQQGMGEPSRARMLGDCEQSDPGQWSWGSPSLPDAHLMLMCYASDADILERRLSSLLASAGSSGLELLRALETGALDTDVREHFGFRDGMAQPLVEGFTRTGPAGNTVRPGEFILGYENEYGQLPISPSLARDGQRVDLGRNGSYLVFRQLRQDVHGLWDFLDHNSRTDAAVSDSTSCLALAAKMMGRWPGGAPVTLSPEADDPSFATRDDFLYRQHDADGRGCPIGAHIRRANPRDALDGTAESSLKIANRHRLLRRGRPYGRPIDDLLNLPPVSSPDGEDRGLHFVCLNSDIRRQFEFVQQSWLNNPKFAGAFNEVDPLLGSHRPGGSFSIPASPVRRRLTGMRRFVETVGGGYFFLPGLAAIREIASPVSP